MYLEITFLENDCKITDSQSCYIYRILVAFNSLQMELINSGFISHSKMYPRPSGVVSVNQQVTGSKVIGRVCEY